MWVRLHSTLDMKCIERGYPKPNVTWTKNGYHVGSNNNLIINNATFEDVGQYGCVAGEINATIRIHVTGNALFLPNSFIA